MTVFAKQKIPLIARAVIKVVQAEAYNVLNNNGRAAGQLVNHVHFHIIPRKNNDGIIRHAPQEKYNSGEFPTMNDGVRGMDFIEKSVASNAKGNVWLEIED